VGTNSGTLLINYDFFTIPDDMRVYYGGTRIFDSGLINGAGTFSVDFGPGSTTNQVIITMDEPGTNPNGTNGDEWTYQVTEITKGIVYATFTEDTNKTTTPIKFAVPPFGGAQAYLPTTTLFTSSFETAAPGDYAQPTNGTADSWTVMDTNPVKVVYVTALAANEGNALAGVNVLALHNGSIVRTVPTVAGTTYTLSFVSHGRPEAGPAGSPGPAGWWEGERNANDSSVNGNNGMLQSPIGFAPGEVGEAFNFNGSNGYVAIPPSASLNVGTNVGLTVECWINTADVTSPRPMLEWNADTGLDSGIGMHFWINTPVAGLGGGPGCLFANLKNPSNNFIFATGGGVVTGGAFQHAALTYNMANGLASIYYNGVLQVQATSPFANYIPNTSVGLYIGTRVASPTDPFGEPGTVFDGLIDEATVYSNALSILQIQDIYAAGSAGKCPVTGPCLPQANVIIGGQTNVITGYDSWSTNIFTFTATSNTTTLEIQPLADGMLVDSFQMTGALVPNPANYYLPEESLDALTGQNSEGNWLLEVWDNRLGATNPPPTLISWQLSLVLDRVNPAAIPLTGLVPNTNCVPPNSVAYYVVSVPSWAQMATNLLTVNSGSLSLLFNQNSLPETTNGDVLLLSNVTGTNSVTLATSNTVPPLLPGQEYYLAVTNSSSTVTACFSLEVDYNITTLTNLVPVTNTLAATTVPHYYQYDVSTNAVAVAFLLYNLSGNVDLVAQRGPPLPTETSYNYISANPGTNDETILISSNSTPVALAPGRWYLAVYNHDVSPVTYTIEAAELVPTLIVLTNDQRLTMTNESLLAAQETFFQFDITNAPAGALFELYNLSGSVDLTLDFNTLPFAAPFFMESASPGTNGQQIVIRTNLLGTNLTGVWYLGTPNQVTSNVTYTIHAVVTDTNGLLVSAIPINPVVTVPVGGPTGPTLTWNTVNGECYDVEYATNLISPVVWTPLPGMPVQASGTTLSVTDPTPITGIPFRFYQIIQTNCP
jgi:hypothetical protein